MKVTSEDLKSLYQEGNARSAKGRVDCLSPETMMRAATGEASEDERGRVADHLATCSDCAWEFRLVRTLKPWAEEAGQAFAAAAEPGLHSDSTARRPPLRGVEKSIAQQPALWQRVASVLPFSRTPVALATQLLLLALLALSGWLILTRQMKSDQIASLNKQVADRDQALASANKSLDETRRQLEEAIRNAEQWRTSANSKPYADEIARLRQAIDELTSPQLDIPIVELDTIRGGPIETAMPIELPRTANLLTLILNFNDRQQHSVFEVEMIDQNGSQIWLGKSVRSSQANKLSITLPRRFLSGGRYLIKLSGLRNDKKALVANYAVTISYK
jgi:uncharacterized protein (UPF0216 family)